jgi:endonuclease YncB( thermonuclease family)
MKLLSLLISLMLGAAVLLVFIQPWGSLDWVLERGARSVPAAPASPEDAAPAMATPTISPPKPETAPPAASLPADLQAPAAPSASPEQKKLLLAREQAEAERDAALKQKDHATAPAPPKTKRYFKVKVRDAGTLEVDLPDAKTAVISLAGIDVHDADAMCKTTSGTWPCGAKARRALTSLIRARAVTCTLPPAGETEAFTARCRVRGQDLSTWLVRQGWATPNAGSGQALGEAFAAAKGDRLGLWAGE